MKQLAIRLALAFVGLGILVMAARGPLSTQATPALASSAPSSPLLLFLPLIVKSLAPGSIVILPNHFGYVDTGCRAVVVGEAQNTTNQHLKWPWVDTDFLDSSGNIVGTSGGWIGSPYSGNLPGNTKGCFRASALSRFDFASYRFREPTAKGAGRGFLYVAVSSSSGSYDSGTGRYTIDGLLRNETGTNLTTALVLATLYDASGKVVGCQGVYTYQPPIITGQSVPFQITFQGRNYSDVASYQLQTDGFPPQ